VTVAAGQPSLRAVRVHGAGDLRVEPVPATAPAGDEAVVRIRYGGVCGSDLHYWHDGAVGAFAIRHPMVLGHEVVGTVETPAADGTGPAAGTPVAIYPAATCGTCRWCQAGQSNRCPHCRYLGSAAHNPHTDGGFRDQMAVPAARLVPIPAALDLRRAALTEPSAVAWHAAERAEAVGAPVADSSVLVVGAGPIGLLIAAVAAYRGAASVTVVDIHDGPLRTAARIGATATINARDLDAGSPLGDVVFEASGTTPGLRTSIRHASRGGTIVGVGQHPDVDIPFPASPLIANELTLAGALRIGEDFPAVLQFLAETDLDPVITHVVGVNRTLDAFELAADSGASSKVLLDFEG
jgi:L-idonate 5-dehydrogenase